MEHHTLKNVNNCFNTNIYSYLKTSGGQSSNLYINAAHFSTPVLIWHLWQFKTVVFLHWCLIHVVLSGWVESDDIIKSFQILRPELNWIFATKNRFFPLKPIKKEGHTKICGLEQGLKKLHCGYILRTKSG